MNAMDDWKAAIYNFGKLSTLVGLVLGIMGGMATHFACALMKYSHIKNLEKQIEYRRVYALDTRWWICFAFYSVGLLFLFVSLYFVQLNVLASIMCIGIWFGYRYTAWYQAEKLQTKDYVSFGAVIVGTVFVLLFSTKVNEKASAESFMDVFQKRELSIDKNTGPTLFYLMTAAIPFAFIVLNKVEKFQNIFVSTSAPAILLALSFATAKIFPSGWSLISIVPLLLHVHYLQTTLAAYSYFAWISFYQSLVSFFGLAYGEIMFNEFPHSVSQSLIILFGFLLQVGGLFVLVNEKLTRGAFFPDRSQLYMRYNEVNYEFDSDEASTFELNAILESDEEDDRTDDRSLVDYNNNKAASTADSHTDDGSSTTSHPEQQPKVQSERSNENDPANNV